MSLPTKSFWPGERSGPPSLSTDVSSGPGGCGRLAQGSGQLTSLSFLFLSIFPYERLFEGCCFSGLPRGVLSIGIQGSWFLLSDFGNLFLTRKNITEGPFLASLGYTCSLVHTNLKFQPLHSETEGPVSDLIFRSIHSPLDSRMHSSIFNLISLFTQTQRAEGRMELTGLIISSHLLSPMCQNCIFIIPSISILPVVSKGSRWCGEQEPDSGIKLGHELWPQVLLLKVLVQGLADNSSAQWDRGSAHWAFTSAFRQSPETDG